MRNKIEFTENVLRPNPVYGDIQVGQLFRYVEPWNPENIYMKTNNPSYCVHLNTGNMITVDIDRRVVPFPHMVSIQSPS